MKLDKKTAQIIEEQWDKMLPTEQQFLAIVRVFRPYLGLGRMRQIIAHEWYKSSYSDAERMAALVGDNCLGLMTEDERQSFIDGCDYDPLFK